MKRLRNVLWGIVIIALGVIIATNELKITNIDLLFDGWWSLFIIIPCFIGLFSQEDKTGNIFGIVIGVLLFLGCQNILNFAIIGKLVFPILLVVIGLSVMFKKTVNNKINDEIKKVSQTNANSKKTNHSAVFSEQDIQIDEEKFEGTNIVAIFGGAECNLQKINMEKDVVINITAIFGGVDIYLPEDYNIKIKQTAIFGGIENSKAQEYIPERNTIYVNAICVFGGVEIK